MPMDKFIAQDVPREDRVKVLTDTCDQIEELTYMRDISPEEREELKHKLSFDVELHFDMYNGAISIMLFCGELKDMIKAELKEIEKEYVNPFKRMIPVLYLG
jgi:hypothetical protein